MKTLQVLIVDDHRDGADSLGLLIEELGHEVRVTYGGRQALDVATKFRADLLLVDLSMPDVDGCSLVKRFRPNRAFAHTRIIAITGHDEEEYKVLALNAGFDEILLKPVALVDIRAALESVVVADADKTPSPPRAQVNFGAGRQLSFGAGR